MASAPFDDDFTVAGAPDPTLWDVFKGTPTVGNGQLHLAGAPGTRAEVQSKRTFQYGTLHTMITSADTMPQSGRTDASFGFESFSGSNGRCHYAVTMIANGHLGLLRSEPDALGNCLSDPPHQAFIPIPNWDLVRARGIIFLTLVWAPTGVTLHVTDGLGHHATASYSGAAEPSVPLRIRLNADCRMRSQMDPDCTSATDETYSFDDIRVGETLIRLIPNQATLRSGGILEIGVEAQNLASLFAVDVYLGILLPDGVSVFFFTNLSPPDGTLTRLDADPRTFPPLAAGVPLPPGLDLAVDALFVHAFTGSEPSGLYRFFALLALPGAFGDGVVDPADLVAIDVRSVDFNP